MMPFDFFSEALDSLLIGVVAQIELSDRDRRVTERRYAILDDHLHRPSSSLRPYLVDGQSRIYAQGSRAIGATIVHGTGDDRFDLDAIVEFPVPAHWSPVTVLDMLYESLRDFPDAHHIKRCKRCVQLQFAFMHLDVTPLDPWVGPRPERAGDIFHVPDKGLPLRFPSNPFGFAAWFNDLVAEPPTAYRSQVSAIRSASGRPSLLARGQGQIRADADVDPLPSHDNPRRDAPQVLALKLLKRFIYRRYADRTVKRPPSVILSKVAAQVGPSPFGLCDQLIRLATGLQTRVDAAIASNGQMDERNPSLPDECFTDRWPSSVNDLKVLSSDLAYLMASLHTAVNSEVEVIVAILRDLFGEDAGKGALTAYNKIHEAASGPGRYRPGIGHLPSPAAGLVPAAATKVSRAPSHHFHPGRLPL